MPDLPDWVEEYNETGIEIKQRGDNISNREFYIHQSTVDNPQDPIVAPLCHRTRVHGTARFAEHAKYFFAQAFARP